MRFMCCLTMKHVSNIEFTVDKVKFDECLRWFVGRFT